jgi:hypothetical protein
LAEGISNTGDQVEAEFRRLTGASKAARASHGDAVIEGWNIEVKKASANTLNQIRAVKFIPLVAKDTRDGTWYVISAPAVVRLVASKQRGQHTENPFESATLNLSSLSQFRVVESNLLNAVKVAIADGKAANDLHSAMKQVLSDSKKLAADSLRRVRRLLDD